MLLRDVEHAYRSLAGSEGRYRARIYAPTAASSGLPIVLLGELASNPGPSITNKVEQIAAEVLSRYLPEQDGAEPRSSWSSTIPTRAADATSWPPSTSTRSRSPTTPAARGSGRSSVAWSSASASLIGPVLRFVSPAAK